MAAILCRGRRSNRNIFDIFKFIGHRRNNTTQAASTLDLISHEFNPRAKVGTSALPYSCSTRSSILSKNSSLIRYNGQQEYQAYSTRCRPEPEFSLNLKPGDKMKLELSLLNVQQGFLIQYITPVEIKGKRLARLFNHDIYSDDTWLTRIELLVQSQPAHLRTLMDKYWLSASTVTSHDRFRSDMMMLHGMQDDRPLFDNYWEETINTVLPFIKEDGEHYLGKIYKDFPRGGVYKGKEFVEGLSRLVGKKVLVKFIENEDTGYKEPLWVRLLLDEEKRLIDHPEHGACPRKFLFEGPKTV